MNSIYIHIPFCRKACHYCDFHFSTSLRFKDDFLLALKKEIVLRKRYFSEPLNPDDDQAVHSVYLGGGTPSILSGDELMGIFASLNSHFPIAADAEITLEANPDDLTVAKIHELKATPVNRLSIGVQSFHDDDLRWMNRIHSAERAERCVTDAQAMGFSTITVDLIYGIPTLTDEKWRINLEKIISLGINHLSAYSLTVEEGTPLFHLIRRRKKEAVDDDKSAAHLGMLMDFMEKNGYMQYEISNFGREGFFSRHNINYWCRGNYLGLGPSAHSFNGITRYRNDSNNPPYIKALNRGKLSGENESLTEHQQYNEYVLTSLRTQWGCDPEYIEKNFGKPMKYFLLNGISRLETEGYIKFTGKKAILTRKGKFFADRIASGLFEINQ